jgi:hypothetical protein
MLSDILSCMFKSLYNKSNENIEYTNKTLLNYLFRRTEELDDDYEEELDDDYEEESQEQK